MTERIHLTFVYYVFNCLKSFYIFFSDCIVLAFTLYFTTNAFIFCFLVFTIKRFSFFVSGVFLIK